MRGLEKIIIIGIALCLSACSNAFLNRDKHYLSANSIPPLRIPPGISTSAFHNEYPVTDHYYSARVQEVSLAPPGLYS